MHCVRLQSFYKCNRKIAPNYSTTTGKPHLKAMHSIGRVVGAQTRNAKERTRLGKRTRIAITTEPKLKSVGRMDTYHCVLRSSFGTVTSTSKEITPNVGSLLLSVVF